MGWFGSDDSSQQQDYNQYAGSEEHKPKITHELLGGAAAFEACHPWEDHQAANGRPDNHAKAKEVLAGLAGAIVDREVETRGLDAVDSYKAKRHAEQQIQDIPPQDLGYDNNNY
ncbi:hypothetical protein PILCRDRAFT_76137 [Piloderma croceum F 1598]|uniref:CipC-like antibiotic response protein n=1 Tax=Piloderma croceum (strain F 1598) TaxID=765440 RepID=A0A0C3FDS3_PILCF|nr:hypothetical protein PILCRDRAFT_76137 [Piloderma croceum F 1598]